MHIIKFYVCILTTLMTRIFFFLSMWIFRCVKLCIFLEWCYTIASSLFVSFNLFRYIEVNSIWSLRNIFHMHRQDVYWHLNRREKRKSRFHFNMEIFFSSVLITTNKNISITHVLEHGDSRTWVNVPKKIRSRHLLFSFFFCSTS
jgi:hypothetical protein